MNPALTIYAVGLCLGAVVTLSIGLWRPGGHDGPTWRWWAAQALLVVLWPLMALGVLGLLAILLVDSVEGHEDYEL